MSYSKHPAQGSNKGKQRGPFSNQRSYGDKPSFDNNRIVLAAEDDKLPAELFSTAAEDAAKYIGAPRNASKPTQLRRFYDEICMWDSKIQLQPDDFEKLLPFILMLKAKVAYAKGRGHVDENYEKVFNRCLSEIERTPKPDTLHHCKFFLEAFTGFYKVYGPKKLNCTETCT